MKKLQLSILIIILCALSLYGQYDSLEGRWLHYGLESGLRTNSFRVITQDSIGFIYIGTDDGLYTFDGHIFREIENSFSVSEGFSRITDLDYIALYNVVIISSTNGIYTYSCANRTLQRHDEIIVNSITYDRKNSQCYYTGRSQGQSPEFFLKVLDLSSLDVRTLPGISSKIPLSHLVFDKESNGLWIGQSELQLYDLEHGKLETIDIPLDYGTLEITDIEVNGKNILIATIGQGLLFFNKENRSWQRFLYYQKSLNQNRNVVRHISKQDDKIYISTSDRGPGYFDLANNTFSFYIHNPKDPFSITQISARSTFTDREGNLWVAMAESLSLLAQEQNIFSLEQQPLSSSIDRRNISDYYLATINDLILQANRGINKLSTYNTEGIPVSDPFVYESGTYEGVSLYKSNWGMIYSNSRNTIYEIDPQKKTVRPVFTNNEIPSSKAFYRVTGIKDTLVMWQSGQMAFVSHENGVLKYSHIEPIKLIDEIQSIDNQIYLSNVTSLMRRTSRNTYQKFDQISDSLYTGAHSPIHLADYDSDHIVLGTNHLGIAKMNKTTGDFSMINRNDGLKTNVVSKLTADPYGNIWALSSAGLLMYNSKHQATATFTEDEGTFSTGLLPDIIQYLGNDQIGISVDHGLNLWNVGSMGLDNEPAAIIVHTIDGHEAKNNLVFPPNTKQINISYSNFDYGLSRAHRFEYSINEQDWRRVERSGTVQLIASKAGRYNMKIRGVDGLGRRMKEAEVSFKIKPYWYQTYWFIGISLLSAFGIGLYIMNRVNQRRKQLVEIEKNYQNITKEMENQILRAQMNPHFLFNSLNSIRYFILTKETDKAANYLTKFSRLIRLILENSNQNKVSLQSELELIKLYVGLEQIRFDEKFSFDLKVAPDIDSSQILIPPMIIQPFLENAILHGIHPKSEYSTLSLKISQTLDGGLKCSIIDDGIGRQKAQKIKSEKATNQKSMGMSITEKRLQMISKDFEDLISISDAYPGQKYVGTKVDLNIPAISN